MRQPTIKSASHPETENKGELDYCKENPPPPKKKKRTNATADQPCRQTQSVAVS